MLNKNIYLVGMPGSGKTTISKELCFRFNYDFVDLDQYIEQQSGLSIIEIFSRYGEDYFRILEKKALQDHNNSNKIISTGGGIVKDKMNKKLMHGIVIFIDVDLKTLQKRLQNDKNRPLLRDISIEDLYANRIENYHYFADYVVINDNLEKCLNHIRRILDEENISH